MKVFQFAIFLLFIFSFFTSGELCSQPTPEASNDNLRVGLVLSGGGAKGIAHIGVIKKLEEAGVRIDYITGTSVGSLIGALYSIGYTSDQLLEIAESNIWTEIFTEKPSRRFISNYERMFDDRTIASFPIQDRGLNLPYGIISGQNLYSFLSRYTWPVHEINNFYDFPIPFATVATNLETGEPKTFRSGYLPDAIRASISIPSLMRPHTIDGVTYIDGGMANNLPVDDIIEMGANYIIAVNVAAPLLPSDSLRTLTDVFTQVVNYRINEKIISQVQKTDIFISPEKTNAFDIIDFGRVDELIQIGYEEAELYMPQFREIAEKQKSPLIYRPGIKQYGALPFNRVIISGNQLVNDEFILSELEIEKNFNLTPDFIDQKISQLFSTQLFELITYQVKPDDSGNYNLHINVEENRSDVFRVGLRYETQTDASILLSSQFRNLLFNNSSFRVELRLGSELQAMADLIGFGGLGSRLGVRTMALYQLENIDQFNESERTARFQNNLLRFEISLGNYLSSNNLIAGGVRRDNIFHNNTINPDLIQSSSANHQAYFLRLNRDSFHRNAYPKNGTRFVANAAYSGDYSLSNISYYSAGVLVESYLEITNQFSIRGLLFGGYTQGDDIPWNSWYSVNRLDPVYGNVRFGGFNRYELSSRNIQMASAGIQFEPIYHRFINFDYYSGRFISEWDVSRENLLHGASISVGALTILGPIQAIFSTSTVNSLIVEIQIGYQF
ncbi:patatin-like phospholipase family protein [soil metagenome]